MKKVLLAAIKAYQMGISPLLGSNCRYLPSCSQYAAEAIEAHGAWRGIGLGIRRILRCHPFARGGYDPVPQQERRREA